jgi:alkanesulfonate monooxygenase SsuD/methylene tetrahydromethanopterin reductase-like flavin-dependent oxidoreductase (luciferase family)
VRIGVQLPEVERRVPWPEYMAMARAAEECGFDSVWVGDHLIYRDEHGERAPWEAWTLLGALAAVTERVALGPLVACAAFHPPAVLAKMAATLAEVSGGRFVLGLGAGWNELEFRAFGLPFDRRVSRFEEAFGVIRRLLAGERVGDAVLLPPVLAPPLMIGSNGPRMLGIALPHVQAWNTWYDAYGNTADGFAALNERITAAAREAGRDPGEIERSACVLVGLEAAARERPATPEALRGRRISDELAALADAGADEAILVVDPITERSIRSLAELLDLG